MQKPSCLISHLASAKSLRDLTAFMLSTWTETLPAYRTIHLLPNHWRNRNREHSSLPPKLSFWDPESLGNVRITHLAKSTLVLLPLSAYLHSPHFAIPFDHSSACLPARHRLATYRRVRFPSASSRITVASHGAKRKLAMAAIRASWTPAPSPWGNV